MLSVSTECLTFGEVPSRFFMGIASELLRFYPWVMRASLILNKLVQ